MNPKMPLKYLLEPFLLLIDESDQQPCPPHSPEGRLITGGGTTWGPVLSDSMVQHVYTALSHTTKRRKAPASISDLGDFLELWWMGCPEIPEYLIDILLS